ncbi:hypothetical protein B484DRAFT_410175, partial [Ochromonadaceae sp. CCMP2298]
DSYVEEEVSVLGDPEVALPSWLCCSSKTARVMGVEIETGVYQTPTRYSKAPIHELETMVEAVDILAFAQRVIEDRNISLLLRCFYKWQGGAERREPDEYFEEVVAQSKDLALGINDFDNVMIDVLMFTHMPLTQVRV